MHTLLAHLRSYWKHCVLIVILAVINQVFSLLDPLIFRHLTDDYITKFDQFSQAEFFRGVLYFLGLFVGAAFVSRVAKNFQDYFLNTVIQRVGAQMYQAGIKHSLELPYVVFEDKKSGETLQILQKARSDSEKLLTSVVNVSLVSLVGFLFVTIYASRLHWSIAALYAVTVPIVGGFSYFLTNKVKIVQKQIVVETAVLSGATTESLRNIELVKSLGLTDQEISRLNTTTDKILQLELRKLRFVRSISFVQGTLINLMRVLIILFLVYLIFNKTITFGQFFALYFYSFYVFGPLQQLGETITIYREAEASMKQYSDIMQAQTELVPDNPIQLEPIDTLSFNGVSFTYPSGDTPALDSISFSLKKGQSVAFVGPSGAGKSSLVKLLVGLYTQSAGAITYNNTPNTDIAIDSLRQHLGFVTQDTQLFAGTIRENLLFVQPDATDADMLESLHAAACDTILYRGGTGLETRIGEGGMKISGGEKQRLSIARALLRKPSLLVFDEATSSLDSITELEITDTIRNLSQSGNHVVIMIAHRLSTIMHADTIYVLEKGTITESGSHDELLSQKGLYYAMWRQQVGER
jgi:ATP-binding cassette subfamily B protein